MRTQGAGVRTSVRAKDVLNHEARRKNEKKAKADEKKCQKAKGEKNSVVKKQIMQNSTRKRIWYEAVMAWNEHSSKRGA